MTEEEQAAADKAKKDAEEKARMDADTGTKLDRLLAGIDALGEKYGDMASKMDAMGSRMDSFEAKEKSEKDADEKPEDKDAPRETAADKSKKDADEKEAEEKAEKDSADIAALKTGQADIAAQIAAVASKMPVQVTDADYGALADAQVRADSVYLALGSQAPRPMQGETPLAYRRRLVKGVQDHSATWKGHDLVAIGDSVFAVAEEQIYNDAHVAAHSPATVSAGTLRQIVKRDETGREIKTFVGDPRAWLAPMMGRTRRVTSINLGSQGVH